MMLPRNEGRLSKGGIIKFWLIQLASDNTIGRSCIPFSCPQPDTRIMKSNSTSTIFATEAILREIQDYVNMEMIGEMFFGLFDFSIK